MTNQYILICKYEDINLNNKHFINVGKLIEYLFPFVVRGQIEEKTKIITETNRHFLKIVHKIR